MSTLKKGNFTPKEVKELKKIKKGPNASKEVRIWAAENNRDYQNTYSKWHYEHNYKGNNALASKPASKTAKGGEMGVSMFTIDTTILAPKRSDSEEIGRMKDNLLPVAKKLQPNGGNISIKSSLGVSARRFLEDAIEGSVWRLSRIIERGKPTGFSRLFRKQ